MKLLQYKTWAAQQGEGFLKSTEQSPSEPALHKNTSQKLREQPLLFFPTAFQGDLCSSNYIQRIPSLLNPGGLQSLGKPLGAWCVPSPDSLVSPCPPCLLLPKTSRRLSVEVCFHPTLPSHGTAEICHS